MTKFTLELEGDPAEVQRVWAAMANEYAAIEREAYARHTPIYEALGQRPTSPIHSSLRGTITVAKGDLHSVLGR